MAGKTVIAIAHRLSTIARIDRIVILDKRSLSSSRAPPEELLRAGGHYAMLRRRKLGGHRFRATATAAELARE